MDDILEYYDYIKRLAMSRSPDADDLVSETFLAAYSFLARGGVIEHPKSWLANAFFHKLNDSLRRKYKLPTLVSIDDHEPVDEPEPDPDKAESIRREINYLSKLTREVMIDYYYNNSSVEEIASRLNIPVGTVKSRLFAGREKIRKGIDTMNETKNSLPGRLNAWYDGRAGLTEPTALIGGDLIVQNLLALAYDKPLTLPELAETIGIPTAYIEPIVEKLIDAELMTGSGGKVATDFIIYRPTDLAGHFEAEREFTSSRFKRFWEIITEGLRGLDELRKDLDNRQKNSLERYFVLNVLQKFQLLPGIPERPSRRDGGAWNVSASFLPAGYRMSDEERYEREYEILGGHRTSGESDERGRMLLCEFDTTLWDNPHRYNVVGKDYFSGGMLRLLRCAADELPPDGVPDAIIEKIPDIIAKTGLLVRDADKLRLGIPEFDFNEFESLKRMIDGTAGRLKTEFGGEYQDFLRGQMIAVPKRLADIPAVYRYYPATRHIVMLVVREAYEKRLHLAGVDYCCPPCVFVRE